MNKQDSWKEALENWKKTLRNYPLKKGQFILNGQETINKQPKKKSKSKLGFIKG
jgi:hypothetical protein